MSEEIKKVEEEEVKAAEETVEEAQIDERVGPSGYPGEYNFLVQLPDGNYLSYLSGLQTVDSASIDWTTLPKLYNEIAKVAGDKTWIPRIVSDPEFGMVFVDLTADGDWGWVAMKAIQVEEGKKTLDVENAKEFSKIQYTDALEYIGYISTDKA